jgi:quercetin dioxygenase-like cupin family protein
MNATITLQDQGKQRVVLGARMTVRVGSADSGGALHLFEQVAEPGGGVPYHVHANEDETFHVLEGSLEFRLAERTFVAGPGTTVHLPRGVAHGVRVVGTTRNRVLIACVPGKIDGMFDELSRLPAGPPDLAKVGEICGRYGVRFL